jgi:hypothetical protein
LGNRHEVELYFNILTLKFLYPLHYRHLDRIAAISNGS